MADNPTAIKSKTSIAQALYELMQVKPYKEISVSEIAKQAGLSRQAFYLNYKGKDDVLMYQFEKLLLEILEIINEAKVSNLEQLVKAYTSIVASHYTSFKILADNNLGGILGDYLVNRFVDMPPILPQQRQAQSVIEHRYINSFWIHAFVQVYTLWIKNEMDISQEDVTKILVDIMTGNYFTGSKYYI